MLVPFVTPYFTDTATLFMRHVAAVPGVRLAAISQDDPLKLPAELRARLVRHEGVADSLSPDDLTAALQRIVAAEGPLHRLLGIMEQVQEPLAEVRERLGLPGMLPEQAKNFRDKVRMKDLLRAAEVPVARHALITSSEEARRFAGEVGYPLVVKPPAGAASQTTYRVDDEAGLLRALGPTSQAAGGVVMLEEFVTGEEHSFDAFFHEGRVLFYSVSDYHPTPLEVMQNPWMQWVVVLPREYESPDIAAAGEKALAVLGLGTGMCHLEWFRRKDGSVVVSEVGGRPPGAQITTLISRAHDVDCVAAWARLMVTGEATAFPERRYAAGAAYLRGQGEGRVRAVHGFDRVARELGPLITDTRLPQPNQEKGKSYEGEGFVLVRHPETKVVEDALRHVISNVRVELG